MRAAAIRRYGGPEMLRIEELPDPGTGPGQLRIRVHAATVNPTDLVMREGGQAELQRALPPPYIPGMELAGVVDAVADGVQFAVGDRVTAIASPVIPTGGAHAEKVVVAATSAARLPPGLEFPAAATLPMNGLTVLLALDLLDLPAGATLGITGAAGAIGTFAVQLARERGLTVIAQCAETDAAVVLELGAAAQVDRGDNWTERMVAAAGGPVDAVLDAAVLGTAVLPAVRDGGRVAALRAFDGTADRNIVVHQIGVRAYLHRADLLTYLIALAADGRLVLPVPQLMRPEQLPEAHRMLAAGGVRGRLVIDWS